MESQNAKICELSLIFETIFLIVNLLDSVHRTRRSLQKCVGFLMPIKNSRQVSEKTAPVCALWSPSTH